MRIDTGQIKAIQSTSSYAAAPGVGTYTGVTTLSVTVSTDGSSASFADTGTVVTFADDAEMYRITVPAANGVFRAQGNSGGFSDCACVEIKTPATRMLVQTPQAFGGVVGIVDARYSGSVMCKIYSPANAYVLGGLVYIESPK